LNNPIFFIDPLGDTVINGQKMEGGKAKSATTLDDVRLVTIRIKSSSISKTIVGTSCHIDNNQVAESESARWYNETKDLDKANGQLFPPRNLILDKIIGPRMFYGPLPAGVKINGKYPIGSLGYAELQGRIVTAQGFVTNNTLPLGGTVDVGLNGIPIASTRVLRSLQWSSKEIGAASKLLNAGATEIKLLNQAQVEELFLSNFIHNGYKNTTGLTTLDMKDKFLFPNGKAGTYHWDLFDTQHGGMPHLQIHDEAGKIIRLFFNK
jgi:hypothetical protein